MLMTKPLQIHRRVGFKRVMYMKFMNHSFGGNKECLKWWQMRTVIIQKQQQMIKGSKQNMQRKCDQTLLLLISSSHVLISWIEQQVIFVYIYTVNVVNWNESREIRWTKTFAKNSTIWNRKPDTIQADIHQRVRFSQNLKECKKACISGYLFQTLAYMSITKMCNAYGHLVPKLKR